MTRYWCSLCAARIALPGKIRLKLTAMAVCIFVSELLKHLIACGASMAEPGEFSKRAFLNGRMDLSEARSRYGHD